MKRRASVRFDFNLATWGSYTYEIDYTDLNVVVHEMGCGCKFDVVFDDEDLTGLIDARAWNLSDEADAIRLSER